MQLNSWATLFLLNYLKQVLNLPKAKSLPTVESVKAASEIYMPVGGRVVEINEKIVERPEILNESPYEEGWLIKIESEDAHADSGDLLEYEDYKEEIE